MTDPVYLIDGARTPMGGLLGELSSLPATELGSVAVRAVMDKTQINREAVDEAFIGCVLPAGLKQCPARQVILGAGLAPATGAVTVNKACGSGMQATIFGIDSIRAGTNNVVLCGGIESMSNAPYLLPQHRKGARLGHQQTLDHMFYDGLEDAYTGRAMGSFAQDMADKRGITREAMDAFAMESLRRAQQAIDTGVLKAETAPVMIKTRQGTQTIVDDEQPHKAALDKIPTLRPVFAPEGTITAANASSISDGASALLLASESALKEHHLTPFARVVAHARASRVPEEFTLAPIDAIAAVLAKTGWSAQDVDLWEINEAFAMVTMLAANAFDLDSGRVNVHGGACAQGHPIGSTGSRIIVSLMYALRHYGKRRGIASLCIGGGEATAIAIELS